MTDQPKTEAPPAENPVVPFPTSEVKRAAEILDANPCKSTGLIAEPPKRKRVGVMIATPLKHFDGTAEDLDRQVPQIGRTLRELVDRKAEHNFTFEFAAACGGLCSARNRLVHEFMKTDLTWFFPWDSDLHDAKGTNADAVLRILSQGQPVCGGLYCKREPGARRPKWVANWLNGAVIQSGGLLQVAELGGGFKAYNRVVFRELRRIFGDEPLAKKKPTILYRERETGEMVAAFYQITNVEQDLLSEDFFLDYLCRCAGIGIIADTVVRLRQVEPARQHANGSWDPEKTYPALDQPWPPIPAEDLPETPNLTTP
jgi:hypothetical protein